MPRALPREAKTVCWGPMYTEASLWGSAWEFSVIQTRSLFLGFLVDDS